MDTIEASGKKVNTVTVTYRFASSVDTCTHTRADINCTLERVYRPPGQLVAGTEAAVPKKGRRILSRRREDSGIGENQALAE